MARQKQKQKQQQSVKVVVNVGKKERRSKSQRKRRVERRKVEEVPQGIMLNRFVPPIPMSQGFQPQAQPDFLQQFLKVMAGLDQPTKKESIGIQAQIPEKKLKSESDLKEEAKISREKAQLSQRESQSFSSGESKQMPYQAGLSQQEIESGRYIIPADVARSFDPFGRIKQPPQASEASSSGLPPVRSTQSALVKRSKDGK